MMRWAGAIPWLGLKMAPHAAADIVNLQGLCGHGPVPGPERGQGGQALIPEEVAGMCQPRGSGPQLRPQDGPARLPSPCVLSLAMPSSCQETAASAIS